MLKLICSVFLALLVLSVYPRHPLSEADHFDDFSPLMTVDLPAPPVKVEAAAPQPGVPQTVSIAAIGLTASITPVSLTDEHIVATPEHNVGWFQTGARPGTRGNANLNGHFKIAAGPGVFYRLAQLKVGDGIVITDDNQQQFYYRVTANELMNVADYPVAQVYGATDRFMLNLTTCAGRFDPNRQDYTQRTVIYSELVQ